MKRKATKMSFEALERELLQVSPHQMINSLGGGGDPSFAAGDCYLHSMRALYKSIYGTLDVASYNQFNNNLIGAIEHFESSVPDHTGDFAGYGGYPNTLAAINAHGVRGSVGLASLNSLFDNVSATTGFSELGPNSRGIINTGGHAVTLTGSYMGSDGETRYSIVDEQNPAYSKEYTASQFNSRYGGVHAIYTVGAQDWHNQAGSLSYSPTEYPSTYYDGEGSTTTPYENYYPTTPYGGG